MVEQKQVPLEEFERLLKSKGRNIVLTKHAQQQSEKRVLPTQVLLHDLSNNRPKVVLEQESEKPSERKFNIYYHQSAGYFHRYVITLNNELRVITVLRTNKEFQRKIAGD